MAGKVDLKVVLLGKEYGGKTSLVERYIHGKFNSQAPYQSVSKITRSLTHSLTIIHIYDRCAFSSICINQVT